MRYFYDMRSERLYREDEINLNFVAPECYYEYCESPIDIVIEEWYVNDKGNISVSYTIDDLTHGHVESIRKAIFNESNVEPIYLIRFSVPSKQYKETLESFGYYEYGV